MDELKDSRGPTPSCIMVDDTPLVFYDDLHLGEQRRFVEDIDPSYFEYSARVHYEEFKKSPTDSTYAGMALRIAYSHALETLFALIGATVQAPLCPAGWLLSYRNHELTSLVRKITEYQEFNNVFGIGPDGWRGLAAKLFPWEPVAGTGPRKTTASGQLWHGLAKQFLDDTFQAEYNSMKHGFRVRPGNHYVRIGTEEFPGAPVLDENMRTISWSDHGTSFLQKSWIKKHQFMFDHQRMNWHPEDFSRRMPFVCGSIRSLRSLLLAFNSEPPINSDIVEFTLAQVAEGLKPHPSQRGIRFNIQRRVDSEAFPDLTPDDIRTEYHKISLKVVALDQAPPASETTQEN